MISPATADDDVNAVRVELVRVVLPCVSVPLSVGLERVLFDSVSVEEMVGMATPP